MQHDEVLRDYLLTNERLKPGPVAGAGWRLPPQAAKVLYAVQPEFLEASFAAVDEDFGGIEGYLRDGIGLKASDRARLRELYLQKS
jgi:protein-tyrosine phosphatase